MECIKRIYRDKDGKIVDIRLPDGTPSKLFRALSVGVHKDKADLIWANTQTDAFKYTSDILKLVLDENKEPIVVHTSDNTPHFVGGYDSLYEVYGKNKFITQEFNTSYELADKGIKKGLAALQDPESTKTTFKTLFNSLRIVSKKHKVIGEKFKELLKDNDVPIVISSKLQGEVAFYDPWSKTIFINSLYGDNIETILHEVAHALTLSAVHSDPEFNSNLGLLMETAEKKVNKDGRWDYAFSNPDEFIAHAFSNLDFQKDLQSVAYETNKTLWDKFIEFLASIFGFDNILIETFDQVLRTIEPRLDQDMNALPFLRSVVYSKKNYASDKIKAANAKYKKDPVTEKYKDSTRQFDSVTGTLIPAMESKQYILGTDIKIDNDKTPGERRADLIWNNVDPKVKQLTKEANIPIDKATFIALYDSRAKLWIAKGNILHKSIDYFFTKDSATKAEIDAIMNENNISKGEVAWASNEQNILNLLHRLGTDYVTVSYQDGEAKYVVNPTATDKIQTEMTIVSPILGAGGTIDLVVDHGNNILSFKDIKTGAGLDRLWEHDIFLYGSSGSEEVFVNPRNKGKLQLMWYMFMTKVENPEVTFRDTEIIHLPNFNYLNNIDHRSHVNAAEFLPMIEGYLKDKNPKVYKAITELPHYKQLMDPATYNSHDVVSANLDVSDNDVAKQLRLKMLKLQSLVLWDKNLEARAEQGYKKDKKKYAEVRKLMEEIIVLKGNKEIDYSSWNTDMSWMDNWLGSASASTNPYVQLYYQVLQEAKNEASTEITSWKRQFDHLVQQVMKEDGISDWKLGLGALVGGVNREKLFSFAYKQYDFGGSKRQRFITEKDAEWNAIKGTAREALMKFVLDSVDQFFINEKSSWTDPNTGKKVALANKVATQREINGKLRNITNLDLARGSNRISSEVFADNNGKYYRGWLPKAAPTEADVLRDNPWYSGAFLKFLVNKYTSHYYEAFYDGWYQTEEVIPLKFLGSGEIDNNQNHTMDLPLLLTNFVQQYHYKQHLDPVYAFANGLKMYLNVRAKEDPSVEVKNTIDWFEDSINLHILGRRQTEMRLTRKESRVRTLEGFKKFNWIKFMRSLKQFFGLATMGLKPIGGGINALFAFFTTAKEAVKNQIGNAPHTRFGLAELKDGYAEATNLVFRDGMTGKWAENKAFVLMSKFRYLPDSYDWYTLPNQLLTARNKLFSMQSMYAFYTLPEEVIATAMFVAQLKSIKLEDGTTAWDHYKPVDKKDANGNTYTDYEWDGTTRGKINLSNVATVPQIVDLKELTTEEINAIKFTYEKIHGGYRLDERTRAEYYILGEMMMQFKKFLPSILKNVGASRGLRTTQGYYKKVDENGQEVLRWVPQMIEGRWRLLVGVLLHYLGARAKDYPQGKPRKGFQNWLRLQANESYKWEELSAVQQEDVRDSLLTLSIFLMMGAAGMMMWDRDDKDSLKKLYYRLLGDFSGNINPFEVLWNVYNLRDPVILSKSYKFLTAFTEFGWSSILYTAGYDEDALTKQGTLRGYNELSRTLPILSAHHDLVKFFSESDLEGPDWLERKYK